MMKKLVEKSTAEYAQITDEELKPLVHKAMLRWVCEFAVEKNIYLPQMFRVCAEYCQRMKEYDYEYVRYTLIDKENNDG